MRVTVRTFASIRERTGIDREVLEVREGETVGGLLSALAESHPGLRELLDQGRVLAARNGRFCGWEEGLEEGDEVAFFPPVSGGGRVGIGEEIPSLREVASSLGKASRNVGAIAIFVGRVRARSGDFPVAEIRYEAYGDMAARELEEILREAEEKWDLISAAAYHRVGTLRPGEDVMIVGVASEHRREAFESLEWIVDRIKERVPIWKKEVSPRGEERWVGGEH